MKKTHIVIISIVAVIALVVAGIFLTQKNKSKSFDGGRMGSQEVSQSGVESLAVGDWVSVMAQKGTDGTYTAEMINVCESEESCSSAAPSQQNDRQSPPAGAGDQDPSGNLPNDNGMQKGSAARTMLSGTIAEVSSESMTLDLDTGETAVIILSDSTKVFER